MATTAANFQNRDERSNTFEVFSPLMLVIYNASAVSLSIFTTQHKLHCMAVYYLRYRSIEYLKK